MMCQPYWVLIGVEIAFVGRVKAAWSNAGTVWPFETVSLPPAFFEPGSCEYFFASAAKVAPLFARSSL